MGFIQAAAQVLFGDIAKLETWQRGNRFTQRAQEQLTLQGVAACRCTVEIVAFNVKHYVSGRCQRRRLRRNVQRHTLRHKVFDVEAPLARQVVAGIGANMPRAGLRAGVQRPGKVIEAVLRLAHHRANHLPVRFYHFQLDRLCGNRLAVAVAQQAVEDHRFARAIEIARAKHKELFAVAWLAGNGELSEIQRREVKIEQRGLALFTRQQQRALFIGA